MPGLAHDPARHPLVTVLILSHRPELLPEARASIYAQTVPRETYQILATESSQYWGEKLNDLAGAARGKYLLPLCDDDKLAPTYLARTLAAIEARRREGRPVQLAFTDSEVFGKRLEGQRMFFRMPSWDREVIREQQSPWATFLVERAAFEEVGGYDPAQRLFDWDLSLTLMLQGFQAAHLHNEFLFLIRDHPTAGSRIMDTAEHAEALRTLRRKHRQLFPEYALEGAA
jgi:hypothetical protein